MNKATDKQYFINNISKNEFHLSDLSKYKIIFYTFRLVMKLIFKHLVLFPYTLFYLSNANNSGLFNTNINQLATSFT